MIFAVVVVAIMIVKVVVIVAIMIFAVDSYSSMYMFAVITSLTPNLCLQLHQIIHFTSTTHTYYPHYW